MKGQMPALFRHKGYGHRCSCVDAESLDAGATGGPPLAMRACCKRRQGRVLALTRPCDTDKILIFVVLEIQFTLVRVFQCFADAAGQVGIGGENDKPL